MPSPKGGGPLSVLQVLNMDYGASVFGGFAIGYEVSRLAASKFKATS